MANTRPPAADVPAGEQELCQSEPLGPGEKELHRVKPLSLLAGTTLAPLCGEGTTCSCTRDRCCCLQESVADLSLYSVNLQLHFFLNKADNIQKNLFESVSDRENNAASVASLLFTCQPYFNHLESTARNSLNVNNPQSESVCSQLLEFSQILCNKLENLVLTCASNELLSLDETEPHSISHFHIGQCGFGPLRVTIFRYCQLTPYLAQVDTGLHKRMRWNVDQLGEVETDNTEYYFLCCEDVDTVAGGIERMWSIGQWIQVSPETDDIDDWIHCRIPQGTYLKCLILGSEEPSCCKATDCLLQLLLLDQK